MTAALKEWSAAVHTLLDGRQTVLLDRRVGAFRPARLRPRHRLTVLVVQAVPLVEPIRLPREPQYGGCTSWVQLPVRAELGEPLWDADALAAIAGRVRAAVG